MLKSCCTYGNLVFSQPDLDCGFFKWHDPLYRKFMRTLILDLRNKIWELKAEANVTTNEEHLQEEEEIMPQIEEMARVPMKMMKDFIPLRKKCASCSSITYFVLTLVLGMFIGKLLSSPQWIQVSIYDVSD